MCFSWSTAAASRHKSLPLLSPPSSPHLPACVNQYSKGATEGFKHTGRATLISVLIRMGKGFWVQRQVTLRVAQKGRGWWGRSLGSDDAISMAMMKEIMGCFTRSNRGKEKRDEDRESAWHDFKRLKSTRVRTLEVRLSHSTPLCAVVIALIITPSSTEPAAVCRGITVRKLVC